MYLRRVATTLASQLPDNRDDALTVLQYLRELIEWEHATSRDQSSSVLSFPTRPNLSAV